VSRRRQPTRDDLVATIEEVQDLLLKLAKLLKEAEHHLGISMVEYADWHRRRRRLLKRVERLCS